MRNGPLSLCLAAAALAVALPAAAQDETIGKQLFETHCAVCHGVSARGDGDMSGIMTIPAPDLTLLAHNNHGDFPMLKVVHIIDGRTGIRAHGNPMPLFAETFGAADVSGMDPYGGVIAARGRVMSVALYLETLQR
ncbi:MAG: cytochrome c [Paracoccaceae bacterium]|nr:cytochrome c [Paracoccaceae bacterium]MDE3122609.1 cytochrome c [Paracoccaceae bacterium]MDE3239664.1 cytochrome c [Paracoccaceae bacterium]